MNRSKEVGSLYGLPQRISYEYMKIMKEKFGEGYEVLIIDDKDGIHSISFANHKASVTMYEPNKVFIYGGILDNNVITPLSNRKCWNKHNNNIKIINKNFYEERIEKKYDFVFCYRSLHEKNNKHIPMNRKLRKLLSSVKDNGYIYIFYHMAKHENDVSSFPKSRYLRSREIKDYFDEKVWEIITLIENERLTNHNGHPFHKKKHNHKVGHVFARKKNNRLVHKYKYNIVSNF
ncbi:MAG: hypothetical protein E7162_01770 [Firmicutes bacterium]|nr:hypothetical protein [Bacillota bacterium]